MVWGCFGIDRDKYTASHNKLIGICGYGDKIIEPPTEKMVSWTATDSQWCGEGVAKITFQNKNASYSDYYHLFCCYYALLLFILRLLLFIKHASAICEWCFETI